MRTQRLPPRTSVRGANSIILVLRRRAQSSRRNLRAWELCRGNPRISNICGNHAAMGITIPGRSILMGSRRSSRSNVQCSIRVRCICVFRLACGSALLLLSNARQIRPAFNVGCLLPVFSSTPHRSNRRCRISILNSSRLRRLLWHRVQSVRCELSRTISVF
jgi:hypothetical protein